MKYNKNDIILSIIVGVLSALFIFLGKHSFLISSGLLTAATILLGVFVLYTGIYLVIKYSKNPYFETAAVIGYYSGLFIILIFFTVNNFIQSRETNIKDSRTFLEKEGIVLIQEPLKCFQVRYGKFYNGRDSMARFKRNGKDFEQINTNQPYRIKWLDSCSYAVVKEISNSSLVHEVVNLGSFDGNSHLRYSKPMRLENFDKEKVETIIMLNSPPHSQHK